MHSRISDLPWKTVESFSESCRFGGKHLHASMKDFYTSPFSCNNTRTVSLIAPKNQRISALARCKNPKLNGHLLSDCHNLNHRNLTWGSRIQEYVSGGTFDGKILFPKVFMQQTVAVSVLKQQTLQDGHRRVSADASVAVHPRYPIWLLHLLINWLVYYFQERISGQPEK